MKKLLFFLAFAFLALAGHTQSYNYIRGDTVIIEKIGGNGELIIRNSNRDSEKGGILYNKGGGRVTFRKSNAINDSTIVIGGDTVVIKGGIKGGAGVDTTSLSNRINERLKIGDTLLMLHPYLRKKDTASLSARIDARQLALANASGTGDTLFVSPNTLKRLAHNATLIFTVDGSKILIGVDTTNYVASKSQLRDTSALLRGLINGKQAAGNYITGLNGDVSATGPDVANAVLANTSIIPGTYTNATVTFDGKGRAIAASNGTGGSSANTASLDTVLRIGNQSNRSILLGRDSDSSRIGYVMGTSISNGVGAPSNRYRYSTLAMNYFGYTERNFGIPGQKLQVDFNLSSIPYAGDSLSILILEFAANDIAQENGTTVTYPGFVTKYRRMIDTALTHGFTTAKIYAISSTYWNSAKIPQYNKGIDSVAALTSINYVNVYTNLAAYGPGGLADDGLFIHPDSIGHSVMARDVINAINYKNTITDQRLLVNGISEFDVIRLRKLKRIIKNPMQILGVDSTGKLGILPENSLILNLKATDELTYNRQEQPANFSLSGNGSLINLQVKNNLFLNGLTQLTLPTEGLGMHMLSTTNSGYIEGWDYINNLPLDINIQSLHGSGSGSLRVGSIFWSNRLNRVQVAGNIGATGAINIGEITGASYGKVITHQLNSGSTAGQIFAYDWGTSAYMNLITNSRLTIDYQGVLGSSLQNNGLFNRTDTKLVDTVMLGTVRIGKAADSVLVRDAATQAIHMIAQSAIGYGNYAPLYTVDTTRKIATVLVKIGESNSAGVEPNTGLSPAEKSPYAKIQILNNFTRVLEPLQIGTNATLGVNSTNTHGIELGIMKRMQSGAFLPDDTLFLVNVAYAGAGIDFLIANIDTAFKRIDTALALIMKKGLIPQVTFFNSQGINDGGVDTAGWRKKTFDYQERVQTRYKLFAPIITTELPTGGAGQGYNNTIVGFPDAQGFTYLVKSRAYTIGGGFTHWDSTGLDNISRDVVSLMRDSVGRAGLYTQAAAMHSNRGYRRAYMIKTDNDVMVGKNLIMSGNIGFDTDDTKITMASGFIGIIKKNGDPGFFGLASGQTLAFKRSNQSSNIGVADTYTNIFTVDASNNATITGGATIGGNVNINADAALTMNGGFIGLIKPTGLAGFIGHANGQPLNFRRSNQSSGIGIADTYTDEMSITSTGNLIVNNLATGLTAPTTSGTTKILVSDANGLLSNIATTSIDNSIATGGRMATGNYTQNWNSNQLIFNSLSNAQFNAGNHHAVVSPDSTGFYTVGVDPAVNRIVYSQLRLTPNELLDYPFQLKSGMRKKDNSNDSATISITGASFGDLQLQSLTQTPGGDKFGYMEMVTNTGSAILAQFGVTNVPAGSKGSGVIFRDGHASLGATDSVSIKFVAAAIADSIAGIGAWNAADKVNKATKVSTTSINSWFDIQTISSNTTLTLDQVIIPIDGSGGNVLVTLPAASAAFVTVNGKTKGKHYIFKRVDGSAFTVTVQVNPTPGTDTIDGAASSFTLTSLNQSREINASSTASWLLF